LGRRIGYGIVALFSIVSIFICSCKVENFPVLFLPSAASLILIRVNRESFHESVAAVNRGQGAVNLYRFFGLSATPDRQGTRRGKNG